MHLPTQTFFRLPTEKRERLLRAIRTELVRVPFDEASINRIVRDADISRGSYYQYFRDREDLRGYLLENYGARLSDALTDALDGSGGDLFTALLAAFDCVAAFWHEPENRAMCGHLMASLRPQEPLSVRSMADAGCLSALLSHVDLTRLTCDSQEGLMDLLEILFVQFRYTLAELFSGTSDEQTLRARWAARLAILKRGMEKPAAAGRA